MSNYTDAAKDFKLHLASDSHGFTKRNMKMWDMILNRLGLPEYLHEFVRGVYLAGNWEHTEWDTIALMRMAENLASDKPTQLRIYNRLKKNCPKFFEWQDSKPFNIILREILTERAQRYKTKARYNFLLYDLVFSLFNLPNNISLPAVRKAVNEALKDYPKVDKPTRKPKKRKVKSAVRAFLRNANEIIDLTGSIQVAAVEIDMVNLGDKKITDLAKALLQIKDL